jgi:hypothetical protein
MSEPYRLRAPRPTTTASAFETLGPCVHSFSLAATRHVAWAASPFVLLLGYFVWLARQGELYRWFNSGFSAFAVTALFVLAVALIVYTAAGGGSEVIRVHSNGLLDLRAGPRAVRWDEMLSLTDLWDADAKKIAGCVLRTTDGAALTLGRTIGGVQELAEELRSHMAELKLPTMIERLEAGGDVRFGALVARSVGIVNGDRVLPWSAVANLLVERGQLVVRDLSSGSATWAALPLHDVPNAFLLAGILERMQPRPE